MQSEKNDHYSQYNLLIPCYFSFSIDDEPQKCRMNFQINTKMFEIMIFNYDTFQQREVHKDEWKIARIYDSIISFIDNDNSIKLLLFFINDSINFRRFVFSLAESGLIVPSVSPELQENDFLFVERPSFMPTNAYSYSKKSNILYQIKNVTQSQMMLISEEEVKPYYEDYVDLAIPFEFKETMKQIEEISLQFHNKFWGKIKNNKSNEILAVFLQKINIKEYADEDVLELIRKCQTDKPSDIQELNDNITVIDKDKVRMIEDQSSKKWSENLCILCSLICKMHVVKSHIQYAQGQYEVAKKIALLLNGESFPGDVDNLTDENKEKFPYDDKKGAEGNLQFMKYLFAIYEFLFDPFETQEKSFDIMFFIKEISKDVLDVFKKYLPKVAPFFIAHNIHNFFFYSPCYATIFCGPIHNIWPIWIMLKKMHNQKKGYASLAAAILFLQLPALFEKGVRTENQLSDTDPLKFDLDSQIEQIVKIASFLYRCKE